MVQECKKLHQQLKNCSVAQQLQKCSVALSNWGNVQEMLSSSSNWGNAQQMLSSSQLRKCSVSEERNLKEEQEEEKSRNSFVCWFLEVLVKEDELEERGPRHTEFALNLIRRDVFELVHDLIIDVMEHLSLPELKHSSFAILVMIFVFEQNFISLLVQTFLINSFSRSWSSTQHFAQHLLELHLILGILSSLLL